MSENLESLKAELLELDRQLQLAARPQAHGPEAAATSPSGQMAALKSKLDERLGSLDGNAWQLLLLEWRYDFALLFDHARQWMSQVDSGFNTEPVGQSPTQGSVLPR